jgi:hypothetical protein
MPPRCAIFLEWRLPAAQTDELVAPNGRPSSAGVRALPRCCVRPLLCITAKLIVEWREGS